MTLHEIGRAALAKKRLVLFVVWCRVTVGLLRPSGGVALLALTLREREEISWAGTGSSLREIAKCLERAVSTVSREVARHGGRPEYPSPIKRMAKPWQSALRPKRCASFRQSGSCRNIVASKLGFWTGRRSRFPAG